MYLISAYFDDTTTKTLQKLIDRVAAATGNHFMLEHQVPPHMTISSFELRDPMSAADPFTAFAQSQNAGSINIVSPGMLLPYVFYAAPVLNQYLQDLAKNTFQFVQNLEGVSISKYYRPYQWMPHITLGKTLNHDQMTIAFETIRQYFVPMKAQITTLGLAKTNPHEDLVRCSLNLISSQ